MMLLIGRRESGPRHDMQRKRKSLVELWLLFARYACFRNQHLINKRVFETKRAKTTC